MDLSSDDVSSGEVFEDDDDDFAYNIHVGYITDDDEVWDGDTGEVFEDGDDEGEAFEEDVDMENSSEGDDGDGVTFLFDESRVGEDPAPFDITMLLLADMENTADEQFVANAEEMTKSLASRVCDVTCFDYTFTLALAEQQAENQTSPSRDDKAAQHLAPQWADFERHIRQMSAAYQHQGRLFVEFFVHSGVNNAPTGDDARMSFTTLSGSLCGDGESASVALRQTYRWLLFLANVAGGCDAPSEGLQSKQTLRVTLVGSTLQRCGRELPSCQPWIDKIAEAVRMANVGDVRFLPSQTSDDLLKHIHHDPPSTATEVSRELLTQLCLGDEFRQIQQYRLQHGYPSVFGSHLTANERTVVTQLCGVIRRFFVAESVPLPVEETDGVTATHHVDVERCPLIFYELNRWWPLQGVAFSRTAGTFHFSFRVHGVGVRCCFDPAVCIVRPENHWTLDLLHGLYIREGVDDAPPEMPQLWQWGVDDGVVGANEKALVDPHRTRLIPTEFRRRWRKWHRATGERDDIFASLALRPSAANATTPSSSQTVAFLQCGKKKFTLTL